MWNVTNDIHFPYFVLWGLLNAGLDFQARFIHIGFIGKPTFYDDLNSHASRYKRRVDFVGDLRDGHAWFKLSNLTLNDTGRYGAKLEVVELLEKFLNMVTATYLIVTVPPIFSPSLQKYHYIQEGASISIHCSAIGPPTPNVTWFHVVNDTMVAKSSGVGSALLTIPEIIRDHSGMYECQAINNPNERPSATKTNIVVKCEQKNLKYLGVLGGCANLRAGNWLGWVGLRKLIDWFFPLIG
ncbi:protein turtle homolog B-like [Actinia tenebrosa]|uniref:Protein turtle homolog B-like n=1 Tax=Actinia tenebrosa TaxID=6105 RepID=A0A6P8HJN6_ACTTE|nr:protein turtle homolog B-like [Actinia tenebrosa]